MHGKKAFTIGEPLNPSDISFNLDVQGNCRVRGDLFYIDGDLVVKGSKVVLNSENDSLALSSLYVSKTSIVGYTNTNIVSSNSISCDISGGLFSRNNLFVGNPYTNYTINDNTNVVGGVYFADTKDNANVSFG